VKELHLIRHFKSSWDDIYVRDFDRGLNSRGKRAIPIMAARLATHHVIPDIIFHSSAVRTTLTCEGLTANIDAWKDCPKTSTPLLYGIGLYELIDFIREIDNRYDKVLIIGHNPTMTDAINALSAARLDNLPTGGWGHLVFNENKWESIKTGDLMKLEYPKLFGH